MKHFRTKKDSSEWLKEVDIKLYSNQINETITVDSTDLKQKIIAFCVKFIDKRCNIILFQSSYDKTTINLKLKTNKKQIH